MQDPRIDDLKRQMDAMQSKLDRILHMMESAARPAAPTVPLESTSAPEGEGKKPAAAKKAAAKKKKS